MGLEAGLKAELGYTRNVIEVLSPTTLTYASTVYNGMMSRTITNYKDGENIMNIRDESFEIIENIKNSSLSDKDRTKLVGHDDNIENYYAYKRVIANLEETLLSYGNDSEKADKITLVKNRISTLKKEQDKILFNLMNALHWDNVLGLEGKPVEVNLKHNTWKDYSNEHSEELDQLSQKFFGDLWEFKNETSWDNVNEDAFMTINADQAKKYFGDGM
ncbi:hypothetical protein, partial [Flammeovirga sp. SJP92]|uniref:hypothetical protein n=1 Tax=Flammeovirga sp. SJP92 TaxID=1775430 RepID=UPI00079C927F